MDDIPPELVRQVRDAIRLIHEGLPSPTGDGEEALEAFVDWEADIRPREMRYTLNDSDEATTVTRILRVSVPDPDDPLPPVWFVRTTVEDGQHQHLHATEGPFTDEAAAGEAWGRHDAAYFPEDVDTEWEGFPDLPARTDDWRSHP